MSKYVYCKLDRMVWEVRRVEERDGYEPLLHLRRLKDGLVDALSESQCREATAGEAGGIR